MFQTAPTDAEIETAALAAELVEGRTEMLRHLFAAANATSPIVIWDPFDRDLKHPVVRAFASTLRPIADAQKRVTQAALDAADLSGFSDWMMRLEPIRDADGSVRDFRYLHYGSEIAASYGRDMTGGYTSEIGGHISSFFAALYHAVLGRGEWVKSIHEPPSEVFARIWRRLIVPVYDAAGEIVQIAVLNVADNDLRAGLEAVPDPVMVVRQNGNVTFANGAARALFGERRFLSDPVTLEAYSGIVLDLSQPRDSVLDRRVHTEETQVGVNNSLIVHFRVTRSVIFYREQLYYLVIAKPE
ncbi:PAS domain-containing protein [Dinoroseobacter sp. S124A]|uniref:PAS domain-containing protein n=1 Tax=Dinoroseobacter sp. S124A TaxID=3415128 RepID=UPI003C7CB7AA